MKINQHIEIVRSNKPGLSSMSQRSCNAIYATLSKHYRQVGVTIVNNLSDLEELVSLRPDLVFLGAKFVPINTAFGTHGANKIWITDYLDSRNIAYTGSDQRAHETELNKPQAKLRAQKAGLKTASFYEVLQSNSLREEQISLNYPLFVKPTNRGGGLGIDSDSVVHNFAQLKSKVSSLADEFKSSSLIEEYLPGREFSVAILKNQDLDGYSIMPIELLAPQDEHGERILSSQVKTADNEQLLEITDEIMKSKVSELAINVFHAIGARDYGRIDIRLDAAGTPHFLEANLIPSLIEGYGNFPKACLLNMKMGYEAMILHIVRLGLQRTLIASETVYSSAIATNGITLTLQPIPEAI